MHIWTMFLIPTSTVPEGPAVAGYEDDGLHMASREEYDDAVRSANLAINMARVPALYKAAFDGMMRELPQNYPLETQVDILVNVASYTYEQRPMTEDELRIFDIGFGPFTEQSLAQISNCGMVKEYGDIPDYYTAEFLGNVFVRYLNLLKDAYIN